MEYMIENAFLSGFLQGIGVCLMSVALWLKYNGEYVLIKKKKGFLNKLF